MTKHTQNVITSIIGIVISFMGVFLIGSDSNEMGALIMGKILGMFMIIIGILCLSWEAGE